MARRKVNKQELLAAAEELLMERGYDHFHFRMLAEKLEIGRSTIYEYFSSKEELILVYMDQLMKKVMNECKEWANEAPLKRLKGYLSIFMKYTQIHRMMQILPLMVQTVSPELETFIEKLFQDHQQIYDWITEAVEEAKKKDEIRHDIPTQLITAIILSTVQLPKWMDQEEVISGEMVFDLLHQGFRF